MFSRQSFVRHAGDRLSAYCQGELPPAEARVVAKHIDLCERCRSECEEIRLGIALAENLAVVPAPAGLWTEVETALGREKQSGAAIWLGWRPGRVAFAAAAVVALLSAAAVWYTQFRAPVRLVATATAPSSLELAALTQHLAVTADTEQLDYYSSEPADLRRWIRQQSELSAGLANVEGTQEASSFRPVGARMIRVGGVPTAVVAYRVDGHHVTIVTARLGDLNDAPGVGWFSKNVAYRDLPAQDLKVLTWGSGGQAYVMVSGLAGFGTRSCFICHANEEQRRIIRDVKPERSTWWDYGVTP